MKNIPLLFPFILLFVLMLTGTKTIAQSCAETLQKAQSTYDDGGVHDVPDMLKNCLSRENLTKEELVVAYRLLTLCYLQLNEPELADKSMLGLLDTNPEYQINEAVDPIEFINLYKTFRTGAILRVGIKGGVSGSLPFIYVKKNTESNPTYFNGRGYPAMGFQAGPSVEFDLTKKIILNGEILYSQFVFLNKENSDFLKNKINQYAFSSISIQAIGHYNLINTSLFAKNFKLHGTFGVSNEIFINSTGEVNSGLVITEGGTEIKSPVIAMMDIIFPVNPNILGGFAINYKIGLPIVTLDVRYKYFLFTPNKSTSDIYNTHMSDIITYRIMDLNEQWSLQNASVNLGVQIPLYKHEKLTGNEQ
ncbi:MAG: PorT family protein [Cyclobacteriaceae bacterium]|nr:PorT family protein [Cyclobacteriaceae bacterium]